MQEIGEISHNLIIIGHSALNSDEDIQKCYDVGMNDFIEKPVERLKLIQVVLKYFV